MTPAPVSERAFEDAIECADTAQGLSFEAQPRRFHTIGSIATRTKPCTHKEDNQ